MAMPPWDFRWNARNGPDRPYLGTEDQQPYNTNQDPGYPQEQPYDEDDQQPLVSPGFVMTVDVNEQAKRFQEEILTNVKNVLRVLNPALHGPTRNRTYELVAMAGYWVENEREKVRWAVVSDGMTVVEGPGSDDTTAALSVLWWESARMVASSIPKAWGWEPAHVLARRGGGPMALRWDTS